jgi:aryl-alcohol dehydrogenase-like predicted oxidoreductase
MTVSQTPIRYEHGVNTFDTANVYSNGLSEVYLGNAIKALNLPREEIVVMTKVCGRYSVSITDAQSMLITSRSSSSPLVK